MRTILRSLYVIISLIYSSTNNAFVVYENTKIWDQESITFYFLDGSLKQQSEVKRFAKLWGKYTGIKFKYTNNKPSIFSFKKYYRITFAGNSNESTKGAINGIIHLGSLSENIIYRKSTILHEFGHMLGLGHEHQRKDRPHHLNNRRLINDCIETQKQSRTWCKDNLSNPSKESVFIQSEYDINSIMHYDISNITGKKDDTEENLNSLSYTDKYYIAMLYNQNITDKALKKMHKQDLWNDRKFENTANKEIKSRIQMLSSISCKVLKEKEKTIDGKYCDNGFLIISKDNYSYPSREFEGCHTSYQEIKKLIKSNPLCQLNPAQLIKKRLQWRNQFSEFGNCKRLETLEKNNQHYYCTEGFSFVTKGNNLIGDKTQCYGSEESTFEAMAKNYVCNMSKSKFNQYNLEQKQKKSNQLRTQFCRIVVKKYKGITCPTGFDYTIINRRIPSEPIINKCFSNKEQAITAMSNINDCIN